MGIWARSLLEFGPSDWPEQKCRHYVEYDMMETFPAQFIGGSKDGATIDTDNAPEHVAVTLLNGIKEIYERQNEEPPFVYVQIGYAENEPWK